MEITLCYTTVESQEQADTLIKALHDEKLIACGVKLAANSMYEWQTELCTEDEVAVLFKTTTQKRSQLKEALQEHHPYEVPCILCWQVEANDAYAEWVAEQTR